MTLKLAFLKFYSAEESELCDVLNEL